MTNPNRPTLPCCIPHKQPFPSGWHWAHDKDCPLDPNQAVGRKRAPARVKAALLTFCLHPVGCTCIACRYFGEHPEDHPHWLTAEYEDAHADDHDDDTLPRWGEVEAI